MLKFLRVQSVAPQILPGTFVSFSGALPATLYSLTSLNFVEISDCPSLSTLAEHVSALSSLTNLVLRRNGLESIPQEIGNLRQLKLIDLTGNKLSQLPSELGQLSHLSSLNVSLNALMSLPEELASCSQLHILNATGNKLEEFPQSLCEAKLPHLMEIRLAKNEIPSIPNSIDLLPSLKVLDLSENKLKVVPGELARCMKLKDLNLKSNKFQDNRFRKLVEQSGAKPVLDYVRQHFPVAKPTGSGESGKGGKKKKKDSGSGSAGNAAAPPTDAAAEEDDEVMFLTYALRVVHLSDSTPITIACSSKVKDIRPHIIACLVRGLDLSGPNVFKKFLVLQNKLHDTICQKRNAATIATHDLAKLPPGALLYDAGEPGSITLVPLNRQKETTAEELFGTLQKEAEHIRKEKKRNTYSGIHTYLYLLENKPLWPFLSDSSGRVISFPPITNCEATKMTPETKDILIEVTSSSSLNVCKTVCDQLLSEMAVLFIDEGATIKGGGGGDPGSSSGPASLVVEQVKVTDLEGNMRNVYPSRIDLRDLKGISVVRD
ncbi:unnamed protein product [Cyprideis torosa]|uniref:Uncharacterized protein n=1 Tax=Cyprideis torosa TaxID=163714 RepID=A0A7R8W6S2_9CRUS|nr:unnamed protein product [Cyprideis torosa]CAG0886773.1 unnamed protein product [Cyprideis torosa]